MPANAADERINVVITHGLSRATAEMIWLNPDGKPEDFIRYQINHTFTGKCPACNRFVSPDITLIKVGEEISEISHG